MKKIFRLFCLNLSQFVFLISLCSTSFAKQNTVCVQQIPSSILTQLGSLRLATSKDLYQEPLQNTKDTTDLSCTAFEIDLNKDMKKDYAFFAVDASEKNYFLKIFIAKGDAWKESFTRKFSKIPEITKGLIYTYLKLKQNGEYGALTIDYSPLSKSERVLYLKNTAVDVCDLPYREAHKTKNDTPAQLNDLGDLCFCSSSYYFVQGKLKSGTACD